MTHSTLIQADLDWLDASIEQRLRRHFQPDTVPAKATDPQPAKLAATDNSYSRFLHENQLDNSERLIIALALAPQLRPEMLDPLFTKNSSFDRPFTEFGGTHDSKGGPFLPTIQTALFLLAGSDIDSRIQALSLFSESGRLFSQNILSRPPGERLHEPIGQWPLRLTESAFQQALSGQTNAPRFSPDFPAKRVESALRWEDLVLNADTLEQVEEIIAWTRHRGTLLDDWQLGKHLKAGFRSLFTGPPGTGKTMTATLLGQRAQKEVYRVDLSLVISKYIGETEKNLERVFTQAERQDWILFLDEADALLGKRTQLKDAHDRFANQEVSYLLQRIEDFDGIVILATNLKDNIDDAFMRRFHSVIHFPMPSPQELLQLWKGAFGARVSFADDVDFAQLSRQYRLSGGSIVNIVRASSLRALGRNAAAITRNDIDHSVRRELLKTGKTV